MNLLESHKHIKIRIKEKREDFMIQIILNNDNLTIFTLSVIYISIILSILYMLVMIFVLFFVVFSLGFTSLIYIFLKFIFHALFIYILSFLF